MIYSIGNYLGIPKQSEVLLLTLMGICCTIFDASILDLNANIRKVWQIALNPDKFSGNSQVYLKYMLSGIILVRTFSVHLYLAFYIVMLWPAIFEERPALLLPWLMVAAIKCLLMGLMSLCIGLYTCIAYGIYKTACVDFVIAQLIDHIPSVYMWCCVVSYYRELKTCTTVPCETNVIDFESEITMRRRKVRSLADNTITKHCPIDEDRHLISVSTIENIVQQLTTDLHRKTTRSLDSLLGVIAAEAEKEELMNLCDDLPLEDQQLTIPERTAKLLKLTKEEIADAKLKKNHVGVVTLFTSSMMDISDVGDQQQLFLKGRERFPSLRSDTLRSTRSEKADLRIADYPKRNATDFMTDISEVEIGTVFNFSSASLLEQKVEMKYFRRISKVDKKSLEPLKTSDCTTPNDDTEKLQKAEADVERKEKEVNHKKAIPPQTSDFSCQASTLSKKVLRAPPPELSIIYGVMAQAKKPPLRTILASPRNDNRLNDVTPTAEGNHKKVLEKEKVVSVKAEVPRNSSLFRTDGYTMAYNERMRNKKAKR